MSQLARKANDSASYVDERVISVLSNTKSMWPTVVVKQIHGLLEGAVQYSAIRTTRYPISQLSQLHYSKINTITVLLVLVS